VAPILSVIISGAAGGGGVGADGGAGGGGVGADGGALQPKAKDTTNTKIKQMLPISVINLL
jgi:hypothetical protein